MTGCWRREPTPVNDASGSGDGHAAVDGEGLPGDVAGGVRGEEDHTGGQLGRVALAARRDPAGLRLDVAGRVLLGHLGLEETGRDRVDPDALAAGPLLGEVTG